MKFFKRRKEQLAYLEETISEKEQELGSLLNKIAEMKGVIEKIDIKYKKAFTLSEYNEEKEKLEKAITELNHLLEEKQQEVRSLNTKLGLLTELDDIKNLKKEILKAKEEVNIVRETRLNIKDILIGIVAQSDDLEYFDGLYLAVPFKYVKKVENMKGTALIYQSLSEDITITMNEDLTETIYDRAFDTNEYKTNIELDSYYSFTEICMMVGSNLYLNGTVSYGEINEVMQSFLKMYQIKEDEDGDIKIIKRNNKVNIKEKNSTKRTRQK